MTALDTLIAINTQDFVNAWGGDRLPIGQSLLRRLSRPAAEGFAKQLLLYDDQVGLGGLPLGGLHLSKEYAAGLRVTGRQHIPADGPLLVLSNHPGLADTVALFASIARPDLRVLALERAFLQALPNTAQRLFMLPDHIPSRAPMLRAVGTYLRKGGALLTFPAGQIEPDPLVLPGAIESLTSWSESVGLFARLAPQTRIVAAIVSGVLSPEAQRNPLIQVQRNRKKREFLGATLQILWKGYRTNIVHVAFSPPILAADYTGTPTGPAAVAEAVVSAARQLITNPPTQWETVL